MRGENLLFRATITEEVIQNAPKWLETERIIITAVDLWRQADEKEKKKK